MVAKSDEIDLTPSQRKEILDLLGRYLPNTEVWLYGSRVKRTSKPHSDLDMVVFASSEQKLQVLKLREALEESYLPFRVDLFIWDEVPEQFKKNIEADRVVFFKPANRPTVD
ncbi:nucleotidyltransferase family protein [Marinobacterium arenosum]|uniref:nucleotidyltransferase family protein n=1 Tax=Marinobacterium arenosum TaxID=2862496 RepID=UPI001C95F765|nr:nucleotidyltransferase domain-containing protein [Marinobacterium arenosum]MBY4677847.1 nucleotidyltransferase domain-containing protein [Marinobacterium arenosum]